MTLAWLKICRALAASGLYTIRLLSCLLLSSTSVCRDSLSCRMCNSRDTSSRQIPAIRIVLAEKIHDALVHMRYRQPVQRSL